MPRESAEQTRIPRLEGGDRLTRAEFERRYEACPEIKKAELIEGVVYVPSPTRHLYHAKQHGDIVTWLGHYRARTLVLELSDNGTVRMDLDNEPQPDALLRIPERLGGRSRVDPDGYLEGSPEFIVEVASSSASYDAGPKKNAYRRNGVQEYLIWRVLDNAVDWYAFKEGDYECLAPSADGLLRSLVFPGLWLDASALLGDRLDRVLEVLDHGLRSPEYAAFKERLAGAART